MVVISEDTLGKLRARAHAMSYTQGGRDYDRLVIQHSRDKSGDLTLVDWISLIRRVLKMPKSELADEQATQLFVGLSGGSEQDMDRAVIRRARLVSFLSQGSPSRAGNRTRSSSFLDLRNTLSNLLNERAGDRTASALAAASDRAHEVAMKAKLFRVSTELERPRPAAAMPVTAEATSGGTSFSRHSTASSAASNDWSVVMSSVDPLQSPFDYPATEAHSMAVLVARLNEVENTIARYEKENEVLERFVVVGNRSGRKHAQLQRQRMTMNVVHPPPQSQR